MAMDSMRALHAEPAVADPPPPDRRDAVLVGVMMVAAIIEALVRSDLTWRPAALVVTLAVAPTLYWRRTHPLASLTFAFGTTSALTVATMIAGVDPVGLVAAVGVVILPYSLTRWASGRDIAIGEVVIVATYVLAITADWTTVGDAIGGFIFLLLPLALGLTVRARRQSRERSIEAARLRERDELARELHDTVAHHVSAIVVQAQAGRAVAATRPQAALQTLEVIEESAARTLEELRTMVGALRRDGDAPLAPGARIADLERLADFSAVGEGGLAVTIERFGDLVDVSPATNAAVFRIAQESIPNARRHARHASCVTVRVVGAEMIEVTVVDDGQPGSAHDVGGGYGIVGMRERAELLGGTLTAGPDRSGHWCVDARLPRWKPPT